MSNTVWDKNTLNTLLMSNRRALERALLVIYANQTHDEQSSGDTKHHNGKGFTGADAPFMSSLAKRVLAGQSLTPNMLAALRRPNKHGFCGMAKYWRQLVEAINAKQSSQGEIERQIEAEIAAGMTQPIVQFVPPQASVLPPREVAW